MKKSISYIMAIVIGFILFLSNALALEEKYIKGDFKFYQAITNETIDSSYYYSDSYFFKSSVLENEHLRTFAASLAFASNPDKSLNELNGNLTNILKDLEFYNIKTYDYEGQYSKDTIGTTIAYKNIFDQKLIVVVIRGEGYEDEWFSNFDLGSSGDARGFSDSSSKVINRLLEYIKENNIENPKILVTGYSRGGSVSNLVGIYLNENVDNLNMSKDDIFVYTFDAANSSSNRTIYNNIHNVVNKNDLITYLYPNAWDIRLNGVEEDITDYDRTITTKYINIFDFLNAHDYNEIRKSDFLKKYINLIVLNNNVTREEYDNIEKSFSYLLQFYLSKNGNQINKFNNYIEDRIFSYVYNENDINYLKALSLVNMISSNDPDTIRNSYDAFMKHFEANIDSISDVITKEEFNNLKEEFYNFFIFIHSSLREDIINTIFEDNSNILYHHASFLLNFDSLIYEHYPNVVYDLVLSKDSFYIEEPIIEKGKLTENGVLTEENILINKYNLSQYDISKINNGFNMDIITRITYLSNSEVSNDYKILVGRLLNNNEHVLKYIDISILKNVGNNSYEIKELSNPIKLYIECGNDNYRLIRVHDGVSEEINTKKVTIDENTYLEFESDKFSTYALIKIKEEKNNILYYASLITILILDLLFIYFYNKKKK